MATPNPQWAAFVTLLDIDGAKDDATGAEARAVRQALTNYMERRFGTTDITMLVNIINAQPVVDAIVTNLTHVSEDAAAIQAAVAAVLTAE